MLRARGSKEAEDAPADADELPLYEDSPKKHKPPKGTAFVTVFAAVFLGIAVVTIFKVFILDPSMPEDPNASAAESIMETPEDVQAITVRGVNMPLREIIIEDVLERKMTGLYKEHPQQLVGRHETYWNEDGSFFVYYCKNYATDDLNGRWAIGAGEEIGAIENGHCASSVRAMQVTAEAEEVQNWEERDGDVWIRRGVAETNFRIVTLTNLGKKDMDGDYVERAEMVLHRRETYWHDNGKYFMYKCEKKDTDFYNRWMISPTELWEHCTLGCLGIGRAPTGRDILDPNTLKGWEVAFETTWDYLEDGGVLALGWRAQSDNPVHRAFNLIPPPKPTIKKGLECGWCRHKIHGVFPSTMALPPENTCVWSFFPQRTIAQGELDDTVMFLERAKSKCIHLGHMCTGVICQENLETCRCRGGTRLEESQNSYETAYLPVCAPKEVGDGMCHPLDAPDADLVKPDFGDNEELSGAALLVFSHGQAEPLKTCMTSLAGLNGIGTFDLYISLDPFHQKNLPQITEIAEKTQGVQAQMLPEIKLKEVANHSDPRDQWIMDAHYRYETFEHIFRHQKYKYAIFVEDFQIFAPDFLAVFRSTAWLMRTDATVWCVSGHNDLAYRATNDCRLLQSSTFSGEGFMISARVWNYIRQAWPSTLSAKWIKWMDTQFHRDSKVCVIPEVPRIRHSNPVTLEERAKAELPFSKREVSCQPQGPCNHFGDVSYLIEKHYTNTMHAAAKQLPILHLNPDSEIEGGVEGLKIDQEYVIPMVIEQYTLDFAKLVGHWPNNEIYDSAWHDTVRGDRHGLMDGMFEGFQAKVLIVDRRSGHHYLARSLRVRADKHVKTMESKTGETCTEACLRHGTESCVWDQAIYYNSCRYMEEKFSCPGGCLPTWDYDIPVFDQRSNSLTNGQCLIPHKEKLEDTCDTKQEGMARLCPCYVEPPTTSSAETAYDKAKWMPKYIIHNNRDMVHHQADNSKTYIWKSKMTAPLQAANMKSMQDLRRYKKTHDPRDNPRRLDFQVTYNQWMDCQFMHNPLIHDTDYSLDEAFNVCERVGENNCKGFTCDRDEKVCRIRVGKTHPSKKGEVTYTKNPFSNNGEMQIAPQG